MTSEKLSCEYKNYLDAYTLCEYWLSTGINPFYLYQLLPEDIINCIAKTPLCYDSYLVDKLYRFMESL